MVIRIDYTLCHITLFNGRYLSIQNEQATLYRNDLIESIDDWAAVPTVAIGNDALHLTELLFPRALWLRDRLMSGDRNNTMDSESKGVNAE